MENITKIYQQFLLSDGISTDSRDIVSNKIFFALSGDNFNGNKFAAEALEKGALYCVIDDRKYLTKHCILVPDVLFALQQLAMYHREQSTAIIIAITGTNGKTTTKELISSVLSSTLNIVSTFGNFNNHIGVPLTILKIKTNTDIAVIEMGANHIGEISKLCEIAKPDLGIITNIGKAHLEGFGSFEGVIEAKNELYEYLARNNCRAIVNSDDKLLGRLSNYIPQFTYGVGNANVIGKIIEHNPYLKISWNHGKIDTHCNSKLYGKYNFSNIMAAIAVGVFFGVSSKKINDSIAAFKPENNRSQKIDTNSNSILLDAYNANPTSMSGAISSFCDYKFSNPYLILGDMFELGNYATNEHQTIVNLLLKTRINNVILIGKEFCSTKNHSFLKFVTTLDAVDYLSKNKIEDSNILIKGSRGMKLESLLKVL